MTETRRIARGIVATREYLIDRIRGLLAESSRQTRKGCELHLLMNGTEIPSDRHHIAPAPMSLLMTCARCLLSDSDRIGTAVDGHNCSPWRLQSHRAISEMSKTTQTYARSIAAAD